MRESVKDYMSHELQALRVPFDTLPLPICPHPSFTEDCEDQAVGLWCRSNRLIERFEIAALDWPRQLVIIALRFNEIDRIVSAIALALGPAEELTQAGDAPVRGGRRFIACREEGIDI